MTLFVLAVILRVSARGAHILLTILLLGGMVMGQSQDELLQVDPTAVIPIPRLESDLHIPLPEQYVWLPEGPTAARGSFVYFRNRFKITVPPKSATLYVAGPDLIEVFLNGRLLANAARDPKSGIRPFVLSVDVSGKLQAGQNVIAMMVFQGDRLAVKIVPGPRQAANHALVVSDTTWKCLTRLDSGWERKDFTDSSWEPVEAHGSIEGNSEFFQENLDAGMYMWPGYDGISPFLARISVLPEEISYGFKGMGGFTNLNAFTKPFLQRNPIDIKVLRQVAPRDMLSVTLPAGKVPPSEHPFLVLDFGREYAGRLEITSASPSAMVVEVQYGESIEEALNAPFLGANEIYIPAKATAYGPKSAFRYAAVRFLSGTSPLLLRGIRLDCTYYPVKYLGYFESSDALVNRIWRVGAYTAHLCMQDDIWDAPKRDRGRKMGEFAVSSHLIETVFGDHFLVRRTLEETIHGLEDPVENDVNGIAGYSAFWVTGLAEYYRYSGDPDYIRFMHDPLVRLLKYMETEFNADGLFANRQRFWPFVDWSPDLSDDSFEARRATQFQFYKAFSDGAWLLSEIGDGGEAVQFSIDAEKLKVSANSHFLDTSSNTFGERLQTNAFAAFSGLATQIQIDAIWARVLSQPPHFIVTPRCNYYVVSAMALAGHRKEALDWIRKYWGGMLEKGASCFWEAYDPRWPPENFHAHLLAQESRGYFVSLCNGGSSGPPVWLLEQVLGIQPQAAGYRKTLIRPDLVDLQWAKGAVPTPRGLIRVNYKKGAQFEAVIELPGGIDAEVLAPVIPGHGLIEVNGKIVSGELMESGTRQLVRLNQPGIYQLRSY